MKKLVSLAGSAALCIAFVLPSFAAEGLVEVGAHMKGPTLSDNVWGKAMVNGVKQSGGYSAGTYYTSHAFIMYVSKDISDNVSVHIAPDFGNSGAGATPSLGKFLGQNLKTTSATVTPKFNELNVKYNLPEYGVQLRAGYMNPILSMDYGHELFWGDQWSGGKSTLYAGAWHDAGLEIYKSFEIGDYSVPFYAYILNGNGSYARDNNNSKAVLFHVEPRFGNLQVFGSWGAGKWGDAVAASTGTLLGSADGQKDKVFTRYSAGAEYAMGRFKVRSEYMASRYNDYLTVGSAKENYDYYGGYAKLFYTIVPEKLTAMYHYDRFTKDVVSGTLLMKEKYDTNEFVLSYEMAPAATLYVGYTKGNWRNTDIPTKKDSIQFNRLQTYVRVTF